MGIVKEWHYDSGVGDIEIGIAAGEDLPFKEIWSWHWQLNHVEGDTAEKPHLG